MANLNAACRGVGNEGFCPWNFARGKVKDMTNNKHVLTWLDEMVALVKPDKVVWIDGSEEQLAALLEGKEKTLLLRLINAENEIGSTMALENFILGFRLGVRMILEALDEDDGSLTMNREEG